MPNGEGQNQEDPKRSGDADEDASFLLVIAHHLHRLDIAKSHFAALDPVLLGNLYGEALIGDLAQSPAKSLLVEQAHLYLRPSRHLDDLLFEGWLLRGIRL